MTCSKSPKRNLHSSAESNTSAKRKPGGQPGHKGKTRKGFGRVDRCEMLRPLQCSICGVVSIQPSAVSRQPSAYFIQKHLK
ncbi:MAG: hypothetical protein F6J94_19555 [Moorea sp. SIO1F2]|nr:hypothetical protein [Moorena sp. SIO3I7]NEO05078.1 hypothetical protein [Moorena sp. SIO3I8]NEO18336.1 hypothetical protein [Moorena sp. SIO4A5]NEP21918.1 hypothetical protein [Moorena sp. SIO3I6]NEQ57422.1 hypothetical protein [Moorena sp. SIO4A1]NET84033.1 hypothetical protein [Moorena sp. SIO1F2]